jgi:type II secretory pathway component PulF
MAIDLARIQEAPEPHPAQVAVVSEPRVVSADRATGWNNPAWLQRRGVSVEELVLFTQQLALLLQTGNGIAPSIEILATQARAPAMRTALLDVHQRLVAGSELSEGLERHPRVFDPLFVSIVRAGEASGELRQSLESLGGMIEIRRRLRARIREAMTYPLVISIIMLGVMIFMMTYMFPRFSDLFADLGDELPITTRMLLVLSGFLRSRWWILPPIAGLAGYGIHRLWQVEAVRAGWDRLKLSLPLVGRLYHEAYIYQLFASLSLLLGSHVPHLEAIRIARQAVRNARYQAFFDRLADLVEAGRGVSQAFVEAPFLPGTVKLVVATGETSGALPLVMGRLSERYREDLESDIRRMSTLLEPILLVVMGLLVGLVAVSFITPLFKLSRAVH